MSARQAAGQFEHAAGLAPPDGSFPCYAALAWANAGELREAEAAARRALALDPQYQPAFALLKQLRAHRP